ncbi:MAG: hypothetical protein M1825_002147 [Sarcosagium campestre]|nr:MAG: hypothetical protein M1825_002147 [Sarcosagium campestre]
MADNPSSSDARRRTHSRDDAGSAEASPSGARSTARFQPIVATSQSGDEDGSASVHSSGTARRLPLSSSYGSIESFTTAQAAQTPKTPGRSQTAAQPTPDRGTASDRASLSTLEQQAVVSPERAAGPSSKKPALGRRASSHAQGPHRGQEFSVDDDMTEVQAALANVSTGRNTLRRKTSNLRRRPTAQPTSLPRVESVDETEIEVENRAPPTNVDGEGPRETGEENGQVDEVPVDDGEDDDIDDEISDTESFTLKDRQQAINETHPFGIRVWKPALYKKDRSVQKSAEGDIHSSPGGHVNAWLSLFNILWTVLFGWWLALAALLGAAVCLLFSFAPSSMAYGRVLIGLSRYLLYPFGRFVKLEQDEAYADEDEGEGRSISEYEQWQSGDLEHGRLFFGPLNSRSLVGRRRNSMESASENDSLLGRTRRGRSQDDCTGRGKRRLFGRGEWNIGRVIFFVFFYGLITPLLLLVSGICWLCVFTIPMGKVTILLFDHLRRHPLALSFHSDNAYSRGPGSPSSSILLCTYRAVGLKYWKYTIDGTNIFLINLMGVVLFVIFDYWVLDVALQLNITLTHPAFLFLLSIFSIVPLAYFIGQAVASISAQSSMGVGAAINAFFSTIVEVFLYCVALNEGKGQLVEGSVIGSIFAGILFLPGLSMCFGAIKRKTQRFNAKSAGVTSTMLLFAVIAAFGPTLFYEIYGTHELNCQSCVDAVDSPSRDCRRCSFSQTPTVNDRFFVEAVRPYCWFAAVLLFMSYVIGLWFTLRTHAAVIWNTEVEEKKMGAAVGGANGNPTGQHAANSIDVPGRTAIRDSQLYKRILGQSLRQVGMSPQRGSTSMPSQTPYMVPPRGQGDDGARTEVGSPVQMPGFTVEDNQNLAREVAEMAATAAAVAARDAARAPRKTSINAQTSIHSSRATHRAGVPGDDDEAVAAEALSHGGGHDAPNWSRLKSSIILLGATVLYAVIAEILVNTVDVVLESVDIDEKFLGFTLFALVPNTTEFLNAISFAMNGNIALSMEIGSAYALQVCLLQIPALVLFSAVRGRYIDPADVIDHTFTLIFPQWDMVTVILCVFLLSYMYGEGKSNYFKGSILILSYLVVTVGFYLSGVAGADQLGMSRFDVLDASGQTFKTVGRSRSGTAFTV